MSGSLVQVYHILPRQQREKQSPKSLSTSKIVHTEIKLSLSDDGKMSFFYPNGIEITDPSMINRIKRTPAYKLEKERMQTNTIEMHCMK